MLVIMRLAIVGLVGLPIGKAHLVLILLSSWYFILVVVKAVKKAATSDGYPKFSKAFLTFILPMPGKKFFISIRINISYFTCFSTANFIFLFLIYPQISSGNVNLSNISFFMIFWIFLVKFLGIYMYLSLFLVIILFSM